MNCFITFRTYGTWLHGDERGSVDRTSNQVGEPMIEADERLKNYRRSLLRSEVALLDDQCRACVDATVREVAAHRNWAILALNVLANHVHVVVSVPESTPPEKVMSDFKAWATRRLREQNLVPPGVRVWTNHGSTRYLNDAQAVQAACHYVTHRQHDEPEPNEPEASATG